MGDQNARISLGDAALLVALAPVVLAPLLLGGVHASLQATFAAIEVAAVALLVAHHWHRRRPFGVTALAAPFALGLALTLVHVIPLPRWIRGALAPESLDRAERLATLVPEVADLIRPVLAFDPPEAGLSGLRLVAALCLTLVVTNRAHDRRTRRVIWRALLVGGALLIAVALAHAVSQTDRIYGVWGTTDVPIRAPLRNVNHLARILGMNAFLLIGRALCLRRGAEGLTFAIVGLLSGLLAAFTHSIGALFAALAALPFFVGLLLTPTNAARGAPPWLAGLLVIACAGAAMLLLSASWLTDVLVTSFRLEEGDIKLRLYEPAWRLVAEHWRAGIGGGAFGNVLPSALEVGELDASRYTYTHVENIVLQLFIEHGVPGAAALLVVAAFCAAALLRAPLAARQAGPAAALVFVLSGDLVDFATDIPAGILHAALAYSLLVTTVPRAQPGAVGPPGARVLAMPVVLGLLTCSFAVPSVRDWRHATDEGLRRANARDRPALLRAAFARHPSDAQYAYELAVEARHRQDPRAALRFANRALVLWPGHRSAHIEVARALAALGHVDQALLEYRMAWRSGRFDPALLAEIATRFPDAALRQRAVPEEANALGAVCGTFLAERREDDAQGCLDAAALLPGSEARWALESVRLALKRKDVPHAAARAEELVLSHPRSGALAAAALEAVERRDGLDAALTRAEEWLPRIDDPGAALIWAVRAAEGAGRRELTDELLVRLRAVADSPGRVVDAELVRAEILERRGRRHEALDALGSLHQRHPSSLPVVRAKARLEQRLGLRAEAARTVRDGLRRWPGDPVLAALAAAAESDQ
jgi:tetratricopeptide (TPR) repeat protein